jgi:low molecular weight phosphotyrosine protein phosphatase
MAEAVFRSVSLHPSHPLIANVDSAGTGAYHVGSYPDPRTTKVLRKNGIEDYEHHARKVHAEDFSTFDWIFAMDADNLDDLNNMRNRAKSRRGKAVAASQSTGSKEAKIMLFGDFGGRKKEEVIDPYYGADNGFDLAYEQMVRFSNGFLKHLEDSAKK